MLAPIVIVSLRDPVNDSLPSEEVHRLFECARATWPHIDVAFDEFASRLDKTPRSFADGDAASSSACDLYLACACGAGHSVAAREFEVRYLDGARNAIARIDSSADFVAEVLQSLRERLLVGPAAKIKEYRGTGPLVAWVRTAAVRTALNLQRAHKRNPQEDDDVAAEELIDPELAILRELHRADINGALQRAVSRLAPEERLLLRFYYVDRLTLAKLAALHRQSVSTVFRRLTAVTNAVRATVKNELEERLKLSADSLDSLLRELRDDINVSLSQLLGDS
jgi:RNA polymerase sigma-70 factor (ECF subfamily)